jgi:hypothetical protein
VLFTLAEKPPERDLPGILIYHLPHLVDDIIAPTLIQGRELGAPGAIAGSPVEWDPGSAWADEPWAGGKAVS